MKFCLTIAAGLVLGCGSTPPRPPPSDAVTIPKPVETAHTDAPLDPPETTAPTKSRLKIAIGDETICLRVDTTLRCWKRSEGVKGPMTTAVAPISGLGAVSDVAVGRGYVCALVEGGKVYCWGENSHGQLGARRSEERIDTPVRAEGVEGAIAMAAGMWHSCALLGDGRVTCWGWNANGQTGSDVEYGREARELAVPEIVPGISGATSIAAGRDQTCVKMKTGLGAQGAAGDPKPQMSNQGIWCWGRSYMKSQEPRGYHHNQPARVEELAELEQLALKDETACGLFKDGHVACWGSGAFSILPSRPMRAEEPLPLTLPVARSFASSTYHGCAILQNGRVSCWGWNNHGELGREPQQDYRPHEAEIVQGLPTPVDSLSLGAGTSCAVVRNDQLWCWGIAPQEPWVHGAGSGTPTRIPIDP